MIDVNYTLIYRFLDAPVPPDFHRSYTIDVKPGKIYFSVDSYGTIILKKEVVLLQETYESFVKALLEYAIITGKTIPSDGCSGGKSDYLTIDVCDGKPVNGYRYHCGGKTFGDLEGDVNGAANLFKALVPKLVK